MPDPTEEFLDRLRRRPYHPRLAEFPGTIRLDLRLDHHVDHYLLTIADGNVQVSEEERPADAVVTADRALFNRVVSGEVYIYSAFLRHEVREEGNLRMVFVLRMLFARPAGRHPRSVVGTGGHHP